MVKAVIIEYEKSKLAFIFRDNKLEELHKFEKNLVGNIYIARIQNYVKKLNGAFIDIGDENGVFLPKPDLLNVIDSSDKQVDIKNGNMYICQVDKEGHDNKKSQVSSKISINGKHVVIIYGDYGVRVSKKIKDENIRETLLKLGNSINRPKFAILFRTSCIDVDIQDIRNDIKDVFSTFDIIFEKAKFSKNPCLLYENKSIIFDRLDKVDEIVTDNAEVFNQLSKEYSNVRMYIDDYPIEAVYEINRIMTDIRKNRIYLKNGANIVIEVTEALTVIDVNSSKAIVGKNKGQSFLEINKVAAKEIARQLRIRNISGIILIDFINMKKNDEYQELMEYIKNELSQDYCKTVVYGFTKLGLLEISRKRINQTIMEYIWN